MERCWPEGRCSRQKHNLCRAMSRGVWRPRGLQVAQPQGEHGARGEGSGRRGAPGQVMQDLVWPIKGSVGQERWLCLRLRKWVKGENLEGLERRGKDCVGLSENQTASGGGVRRSHRGPQRQQLVSKGTALLAAGSCTETTWLPSVGYVEN